jgi:hypothetical protein
MDFENFRQEFKDSIMDYINSPYINKMEMVEETLNNAFKGEYVSIGFRDKENPDIESAKFNLTGLYGAMKDRFKMDSIEDIFSDLAVEIEPLIDTAYKEYIKTEEMEQCLYKFHGSLDGLQQKDKILKEVADKENNSIVLVPYKKEVMGIALGVLDQESSDEFLNELEDYISHDPEAEGRIYIFDKNSAEIQELQTAEKVKVK